MPADVAADGAGQFVEVRRPGAKTAALKIAGDRVGDGPAGLTGQSGLQRLEILAARHLGAVGRFDGEGHPQVCGKSVDVERGDRYQHTGSSVQFALQDLQQRLVGWREVGEHRPGGVGCGNEVAPQVLGQRTDQRRDELLPQRGHLPAELRTAQPGQYPDRHVHGDPVVVGAWSEPVGQRQRQVFGCPVVGPVILGLLHPEQVLARHGQQVRGDAAGRLPPPVEVPGRDHLGRNAGVIESVDLVVTHHQVAASGAFLQLRHLGPQGGVVGEEVVAGLPVAVHQGVPDEQLPRQFWVHPRVADPSARDQSQAVERHPFIGQHRPACGIPVRFAVAALHQMTGDPLDHVGFDARRGAPVQPAGLHEIGHHDPPGWPLGQHRARCQHESDVARPGVVARLAFPQTDVGEQPGYQGRMHPSRIGGLRIGLLAAAQTDSRGDAT